MGKKDCEIRSAILSLSQQLRLFLYFLLYRSEIADNDRKNIL